jgi:hypothetical protein
VLVIWILTEDEVENQEGSKDRSNRAQLPILLSGSKLKWFNAAVLLNETLLFQRKVRLSGEDSRFQSPSVGPKQL